MFFGSRRFWRFLIVLVVPVLPIVGQAPRTPRQIDVVANDYTFLPLPPDINAGPTVFTFVNQGKVMHEVNLVRLKPGVTLADFVNPAHDAFQRRELIDRSVGVLYAGPANAPDGRLLVELVKGSTYVAYCVFRDTPNAPPHLTLGMYTSFKPR